MLHVLKFVDFVFVVVVTCILTTPGSIAFHVLPKSSLHRMPHVLVMKDDLLSFGKQMDITLRLPTKDNNLVSSFLCDPQFIVENTWDMGKLSKISEKTYLMQFAPIPLPGVESIVPEIEVDFYNVGEHVEMLSGNWTLRGTSGATLKDSRFVSSFDIKLNGKLEMVPHADPNTPLPINLQGRVIYQVQGEKPSILKAAPNVLVDRAISAIQDGITFYVKQQFSAKLQQSFRLYVSKVYNKRQKV